MARTLHNGAAQCNFQHRCWRCDGWFLSRRRDLEAKRAVPHTGMCPECAYATRRLRIVAIRKYTPLERQTCEAQAIHRLLDGPSPPASSLSGAIFKFALE
jgi:hypothetical protein